MCIHHIAHHVPCGHTTQPLPYLVASHCFPVTQALQFYHDQPRRALYSREGRCFSLNPMKTPRACGADLVHPFRQVQDTRLLSANSASLTTATSPPQIWHPNFTMFALDLFHKNESIHSILILLQTEFPALAGQLSLGFLQYLQSAYMAHGELIFDPNKDLPNEGSAGDIITFDTPVGCGRTESGDERCLEGWDSQYGGKAYCPYMRAMETGKCVISFNILFVWSM